MYKKYYNEYEKKAEQIRKGNNEIKVPVNPVPVSVQETADNKNTQNIFSGLFDKFAVDDIILLVIIVMLLQEDNKDKMLLLILGYLFISGI